MKLLRFGKKSFLSFSPISGFVILILNFISISSILADDNYSEFKNARLSSSLINPISLPYFPKIYEGGGVDHMNINLVSLKLTGLAIGDEIGVFDGSNCVGSKVIDENSMTENSLSIPSSANELTPNNPNGFIQGNKITLKVYREGKVYLLYFQTVLSSKDVFEKGGSMFALVDITRSTGMSFNNSTEDIKMYPNPFNELLKIEINFPNKQHLKISIFDLNGKLIRTLYEGFASERLFIGWDGKNNNQQQVASGVYFCKVNQTISGVIYQGIK